VKLLHCTSRLGFNFSYSTPLKRKRRYLSTSGSLRCSRFHRGFSPFFYSETIRRVDFVSLSKLPANGSLS
jgi:hypothetical protein